MDLFLGKTQGSQQLHSASCNAEAEAAKIVKNRYRRKLEEVFELGCNPETKNIRNSSADDRIYEQEDTLKGGSTQPCRSAVGAGTFSSNPLDRLFPFMKQSSERDVVAKENSEPKQEVIRNSCTTYTTPPGIALPEKPLCAPREQMPVLHFPPSTNLYNARFVYKDEESRMHGNRGHEGIEPLQKAKKMPCPPGFHFASAPKPLFAMPFLDNPQDNTGQDVKRKNTHMQLGDKYIPPHLQGRP